MNCRSVKNKPDDLAALISVTNPSIVMSTESWLDQSVLDTEVFPEGFTVYRNDRNSRGGGVFLLVHESLISCPVAIEGLSCEAVWCRISLQNGQSLSVGSFYRPPNSTIDHISDLYKYMSAISSENILLGGDFNFPDIQWCNGRPVTSNSSAVYAAFVDIINDFELYQFVDEPTRSGDGCSTVLDLVLCNKINAIESTSVLPGISDHDAVVTRASFSFHENATPCGRKVYIYERGDYTSITNDLFDFLPDFEALSDSDDVDYLWNVFKSKIHELVDAHIPSRTISSRRRKDKPWVSKELRD